MVGIEQHRIHLRTQDRLTGALESGDDPIDDKTAAEKDHDHREQDERPTQPGTGRAEFNPYQEILNGGGIDSKKDQVGQCQDGERYEQADPACGRAICHRASLAFSHW